MEKFTVDLDRVLDEFEYSEDCAEQPNTQNRCDSQTLKIDNICVEDELPTQLCNNGSHQGTNSRETTKPSFQIKVLHVDNTFLGSRVDDEIKRQELIDKSNTKESPNILNVNSSIGKLRENETLLPCKLNVSGVFSCLNEYINSGGVAFKIGETDGNNCEEHEHGNLDIDEDEVIDYEINHMRLNKHSENAGLGDADQSDKVLKYHILLDENKTSDSGDSAEKCVTLSSSNKPHLSDGLKMCGDNNSSKIEAVKEFSDSPKSELEIACYKGSSQDRNQGPVTVASVAYNADEEYDEVLLTMYLNELEEHDIHSAADESLIDKTVEANNQENIYDALVSSSVNAPSSEGLCTSVVSSSAPSSVVTAPTDSCSAVCSVDSKTTSSHDRTANTAINDSIGGSSPAGLVNTPEKSPVCVTNSIAPTSNSSDLNNLTNSSCLSINKHSNNPSATNSVPVNNSLSVTSEIPVHVTKSLVTNRHGLDSVYVVNTESNASSIAAGDAIASVCSSIDNSVTTDTSSIHTVNAPSSIPPNNINNIISHALCPITVTANDHSSNDRMDQNAQCSDSSFNSVPLSFLNNHKKCVARSSNTSNAISSDTAHSMDIETDSCKSSVSDDIEPNNLPTMKNSVHQTSKYCADDESMCPTTSNITWFHLPYDTASSDSCSKNDVYAEDLTVERNKEKQLRVEEKLVTVEPTPNVNSVVTIECQQTNRDSQDRTFVSESESWNGTRHESVNVESIDTTSDHSFDDSPRGYSNKLIAVSSESKGAVKSNDMETRDSIPELDNNDCSSIINNNLYDLNCGSTSLPQTTLKDINNDQAAAADMAENTSEMIRDTPLSSPDTSETSSVEASTHQFQPHEASNNGVECASDEQNKLGKIPPFWVPDDQAPTCMHCNCKFTVLKRRHHCRACGKVFCSKCCCQKYRLEYLNTGEVRVCQQCFDVLIRDAEQEQNTSLVSNDSSNASYVSQSVMARQPNPNNPMEYCSTIPPLEQAASALSQPVPSVLVPVGVLKREGSSRVKSDVTKQVMFSDGIRPGGDLTELDVSPDECVQQSDLVAKRMTNFSDFIASNSSYSSSRPSRSFEQKTKNFFSADGLPPLAVIEKGKLKLEDIPLEEIFSFMTSLRNEANQPAVFALNKNLFVKVKILDLDCCVNRTCWCFSSVGMSCVGQDEIVIILECLPEDTCVPKDIFHYLNSLYHDASRGNLVTEMGHTIFKSSTFLGSAEHGGFLFIRPSFQCLQKIIQPPAPYLVGILIHRWEIPWAKVFPIRLMLRLGAEFRYYPCLLVSIRLREAVYCEIGHTIINLLADFHTMRYTLPSIRGMVIHMEDRHTSILLPKNRYDQVARALNNSNDHVLALAANFSLEADSHLVCIQSHTDDSYHTQAINIHNKPRKVTGASFVVFNGALKISSNLMAKSTIVEDGLMVQITQDMIQELRSSLHKMKDFVIRCGPASASVPDEVVELRWVEDDHNFNVGVKSVIDGLALDGMPSIRVHNGSDFLGKTRFIRWTEVFILQLGNIVDGLMGANDPIDISRIAENLAIATCMALSDFLDLLAQGGFTRIAVRANIHQDNVGYCVGGQGEKLAPIYMKTLDSTLVPVLHHTANLISNCSPLVLELLFHIMFQ